jgi:hypothetical protein
MSDHRNDLTCDEVEDMLDELGSRAINAEAEVERLTEALETICEIGETRDVLIAQAALAGRENP